MNKRWGVVMPFTHRSTLMNIFQGTGEAFSFDLSSEHWYDLDLVLSILGRFDSSTQLKIGECVPRNSRFPSTINTFELALQNLNRAYRLNHLGGSIGAYEVEPMTTHGFVVACNNPYPFYFNYGLIDGLGKRFNIPIELNTLSSTGGGKFEVLKIPRP